jgi:hypothetical protein
MIAGRRPESPRREAARQGTYTRCARACGRASAYHSSRSAAGAPPPSARARRSPQAPNLARHRAKPRRRQARRPPQPARNGQSAPRPQYLNANCRRPGRRAVRSIHRLRPKRVAGPATATEDHRASAAGARSMRQAWTDANRSGDEGEAVGENRPVINWYSPPRSRYWQLDSLAMPGRPATATSPATPAFLTRALRTILCEGVSRLVRPRRWKVC